MATKTMLRAEELVRTHVEYFNARKLEEGSRHVTNDCEWLIVPFEETYRGPEGYVECNENWTVAFPDAKVELTRIVATDNVAAVEMRGRGTHKGTLQGRDGAIKPTGKKVDLPLCEIYEFKNDKLRRVHTYFDNATLMRQLGLGS